MAGLHRARPLAIACAWLACGSAGSQAQAYEPAINYMLQCRGCHGPVGLGEPGRVPAVRATLRRFASLPAGRRFMVQVPGAAQSQLSDAELAELLNWMVLNLGERSSGNTDGFQPYTQAEVARYRRTPLVNVRSERARLLASLAARRPVAGSP
jgi:hypothetical protein